MTHRPEFKPEDWHFKRYRSSRFYTKRNAADTDLTYSDTATFWKLDALTTLELRIHGLAQDGCADDLGRST